MALRPLLCPHALRLAGGDLHGPPLRPQVCPPALCLAGGALRFPLCWWCSHVFYALTISAFLVVFSALRPTRPHALCLVGGVLSGTQLRPQVCPHALCRAGGALNSPLCWWCSHIFFALTLSALLVVFSALLRPLLHGDLIYCRSPHDLSDGFA